MSGEFPKSIVCLTEETVEFLYELGLEDLIVGVSNYVERPPEARRKPTVTTFTHANLKKIIGHAPDLVIGFSDIQKDIAKSLIGEGLNVYVSNHRSLEETLDFLCFFGRMVNAADLAEKKVAKYRKLWAEARARGSQRERRPKVYIEEWDEPQIVGIQWFKEVVESCGGIEVFEGQKSGALAKERFASPEEVASLNPDIVLASWCGKPVNLESFAKRSGWENVQAVRTGHCYELPPEIILQPGPALFKEGFDLVHRIFDEWEKSSSGQ